MLFAVLILLLLYRNGDEEPVPRGYIVKGYESPLTIEELMQWMRTELTSRMQLLGGAAFIEAIPISNVSRPCLETQTLAHT
jgi:4-coumarate--CoA ligase